MIFLNQRIESTFTHFILPMMEYVHRFRPVPPPPPPKFRIHLRRADDDSVPVPSPYDVPRAEDVKVSRFFCFACMQDLYSLSRLKVHVKLYDHEQKMIRYRERLNRELHDNRCARLNARMQACLDAPVGFDECDVDVIDDLDHDDDVGVNRNQWRMARDNAHDDHDDDRALDDAEWNYDDHHDVDDVDGDC
jgi:hypothetical protein